MRTFGLSGLMGACSGCASKRAGRFIIFGVRTVFASESLQPATQDRGKTATGQVTGRSGLLLVLLADRPEVLVLKVSGFEFGV
jgi:uncharacterized membrane protein (DUF4010 family)